ncbi:protein neprosin-like [Curcuma longa]|uniref:protein neprosin-like n=1 Tax=Curcuma longa TaxID=136217 RepID=UPI003D9E231B
MSLMDIFAVIVTRRRVSLCFVTWNIAALMIHVSMIIHTVAVVDGEADDSHLEAHLKRLNKPAVKTMKTQHGDIFDCVPMYKQPAFDHPLLANHTIQMKPSFVLNMDYDANHTGSDPLISTKHVGQLEIQSCPLGTVPIRRTQISDLRRVAKLQNYGKHDESDHERQEQAGVMLERGGPYLGARGRINVWDIEVNDGEWSHSAIEISDQKSDFIEAGWLVHPQLFGDQKPRLYTFWTANGYYNTGCYNLLCPGFIQVSQNITLGGVLDPTSIYNGTQYVLDTVIYRDPEEMNWWLEMLGEPVGYWPKELFGGRFEEAMEVKWIGSVLHLMSGVNHTTTMMGSGRFPQEGFGKAAFFHTVEVMNERGKYERPMYREFYQTNKGCYEVDPVVQDIYFYFGGPGGRYTGCRN